MTEINVDPDSPTTHYAYTVARQLVTARAGAHLDGGEEVWGRIIAEHVDGGRDTRDIEFAAALLACLSEMVVLALGDGQDALGHLYEALDRARGESPRTD